MTAAEALRWAADEVLSAIEKYDQGRMRSDRDRWLGAMGAAERMRQEASRLEALGAKAAELTDQDTAIIGGNVLAVAESKRHERGAVVGRALIRELEVDGFAITRKAKEVPRG